MTLDVLQLRPLSELSVVKGRAPAPQDWSLSWLVFVSRLHEPPPN
jgi:hypothetical protein